MPVVVSVSLTIYSLLSGIALEGLFSFLAGWAGAGHATSTFGGNIGAIGITRVTTQRHYSYNHGY